MELEIRSPIARDLELLARSLPMNTPERHREGMDQQASGRIHYLVAWLDGDPVGHGMIHWAGPRDPEIRALLGGSPEIYNLGVREDRRCRGVGSALMAALECRVAARSFREVGLAVALENTRARALYDRLDYRPADAPVFIDRWRYTDPQGVVQTQEDPCCYMLKGLAEPSGPPRAPRRHCLSCPTAPGGVQEWDSSRSKARRRS